MWSIRQRICPGRIVGQGQVALAVHLQGNIAVRKASLNAGEQGVRRSDGAAPLRPGSSEEWFLKTAQEILGSIGGDWYEESGLGPGRLTGFGHVRGAPAPSLTWYEL